MLPNTCVNGPSFASRHPGNLNICFNYNGADELLSRLNSSVAASSGSACSSGTIEPSYVLRAIGLNETQANRSIRFSLSRDAAFEDLDLAAKLIFNALLID